MLDRLKRAWPVLPIAAVLLLQLGPLLLPGRVLMARDVTSFHLPLRTAVVQLAERHALPEWNPLLNGGQPILSNPNYAWLYPPTWLARVVPVADSLALLLMLHGAIAAAGAWTLLRRLGAEPVAATLGTVGFACSTWFLSLAHSFTSYCGFAWLPWALLAGDRLLRSPETVAGSRRAVVGCSVVLAVQLLAGEPVVVLATVVAIGCMVLGTPRQLGRGALRLSLACALAAMLGAVQLLPTAIRLQGSERSTGIAREVANAWSSQPARMVDFVLPRFWGQATRGEEGLWFGWAIHDRSFPYVVALYSGLLLVVLAIAAVTWPIPRRAGWLLTFLVGVFLALGRHNPAWGWLQEWVPLLDLVRFPERFLVLSAAAVPLAGALGWQHLSATVASGRRAAASFPLALAAVVGSVVATLAVALAAWPALSRAFVAHHGQLLSTVAIDEGVAALQRESRFALLVASATVLLFAAWRMRGGNGRVLATAALLLLAGDLAWYGQGLLRSLPATTVLARPALASAVEAAGGRVYYSSAGTGESEIHLRVGPQGFHQAWAKLQGLEPYSGLLWGVGYALNTDFDLMLTRWGRHANQLVPRQAPGAWGPNESLLRLAGAWDVRTLIYPRRPSEVMAELRRTRRLTSEVRTFPNPHRLPHYRFVTEVGQVASAAEARRLVPRLGYDLRGRDFCIDDAGTLAGRYAPARLRAVDDEGQVVRVTYQSPGPAFLVAATTYDEGWSAALEDGTPVALCPTAIGQIGAALPAGEHTVRLAYRDRWVRIGAGISLATAAALLLAWRRPRSTAALAAVPTPPPVQSAP